MDAVGYPRYSWGSCRGDATNDYKLASRQWIDVLFIACRRRGFFHGAVFQERWPW